MAENLYCSGQGRLREDRLDRNDESYMGRAIDLALGPPFTSPNPRVGAVVVRGGRVISEAAHEGAGTAHAEARALEGVDARGATLYVSLEPCMHTGRTPPCAPAIVAAGVTRVVGAMEDPDERTRGKGFDYLEGCDVEVTTGVLHDAAARINARWSHQRRTGRPFVTLKLALSIDGRMAAPDGSARWITGPAARARVHSRRGEADAVMVGAGTVVADDPGLTVREAGAIRKPATVVVDGRGRISAGARLFGNDQVVVATTAVTPQGTLDDWDDVGAEVIVLPPSPGGVDLGALFDALGGKATARHDFVEVYCEGGAALATSLLADDLVDRLEIFFGPVALGAGGPALGPLGIGSLPSARRWRLVDLERIDDDALAVYEKDHPERTSECSPES